MGGFFVSVADTMTWFAQARKTSKIDEDVFAWDTWVSVAKTSFLRLWAEEANEMNGIRVYYCRNAVEGNVVPAELADLGMRDDVALEAVPCGGRVDPRYILKAFEGGAYAVCVLTCPISHCKLMEGNVRAARRVELAREMLAEAGIDPKAVQIVMPSEPGDAALRKAIESITRFVEESSRVADGVMV